jgi:hypothetical protein
MHFVVLNSFAEVARVIELFVTKIAPVVRAAVGSRCCGLGRNGKLAPAAGLNRIYALRKQT